MKTTEINKIIDECIDRFNRALELAKIHDSKTMYDYADGMYEIVSLLIRDFKGETTHRDENGYIIKT